MEPAHQKVFYMVLGGKEVGKNQLMLAGHPTESALQAEIDGILYFREYKFYLRQFKDSRHKSYEDTDVVVIAFSIVDPDSFKLAEQKWAKEVRRFGRGVPIIIVGTKFDWRDETTYINRLQTLKNRGPITTKEGAAMAQRVGAAAYLETSIKHPDSLLPLRDEIFRLYRNPPPRAAHDSACSIL